MRETSPSLQGNIVIFTARALFLTSNGSMYLLAGQKVGEIKLIVPLIN